MQENDTIQNKYKESFNNVTQNIIKKRKEYLKDMLEKVKDAKIDIKYKKDEYFDGSEDVICVYEEHLQELNTIYKLIELLYNYNIELLGSLDKLDENLIKELKKDNERISRSTAEKTILKSMKYQLDISPIKCPECGHHNSPDAKYCNQCRKKLF